MTLQFMLKKGLGSRRPVDNKDVVSDGYLIYISLLWRFRLLDLSRNWQGELNILRRGRCGIVRLAGATNEHIYLLYNY